MKRLARNIIRVVFASLASVAIGLQLVNISVNTHFHILPSGQIVTHSHGWPNGNRNLPNHKHSNNEFCLLSIAVADSCPVPILLPVPTVQITDRGYSFHFQFLVSFNTRSFQGRAPPIA